MKASIPEISVEQIEARNSLGDVWIIMKDRQNECIWKVYDVSHFLNEHPGGGEILVEYAGRDVTELFESFGHTQEAIQMTQKYVIGMLPMSEEDRQIYLKSSTVRTLPEKAIDFMPAAASWILILFALGFLIKFVWDL